jgi:hypothetical protein
MPDIALADYEGWYNEQLARIFVKERLKIAKFLDKLRRIVGELKLGFKSWTDPGRKVDPNVASLEGKSQQIMVRFVEKMLELLEGLPIPADDGITFAGIQALVDQIQQLFGQYNDLARKSVPKFHEQYKLEIREMDSNLHKLGDIQEQLFKFVIKK